MKLLFRLIIALAICLVAIPAAAPVVPVQADVSYMWLSDDEGYVGDEVTVHAEDVAYSRVWIYYELYNEDEDDWPYWKVYCEDAEVAGGTIYYLDRDIEIPESCMGEHEIRICYDDDPDKEIGTIDFTVHPTTEIDGDEGPAGIKLKAKGTGYDEDESKIEIRFYLKDPGTTYYDNEDYYVVVASEDIKVDDYGTWKDVTFEVPPSNKGEHKIYAVGNKADDIEDDEIIPATFTIKPGISLDKSSGYVGAAITVKGSGFEEDEENIKVTYDDEVVKTTSADENGAWEVKFEAPPSTKGTHGIDASGEDTKAKDIKDKNFTVSPKMTLTPTKGHVGTSLTVSGDGFPASKSVTISYDGSTKGTATADDKGSISGISFKATHTQSVHTANHPVVATYDSTTVPPTNFVMESQAPSSPTPTTPTNGSRVGLIGKQTPTLTWSAVTDDSGVSYNLQVSRNTNFATLIIPELSGLTQESYTIPNELALSYGTYYWRVKAVDGAQNIGKWSDTYSFRSGFLPFWTFIVIVALIVVLICVLVYFFAIRRRRYYD